MCCVVVLMAYNYKITTLLNKPSKINANMEVLIVIGFLIGCLVGFLVFIIYCKMELFDNSHLRKIKFKFDKTDNDYTLWKQKTIHQKLLLN